MTKTKKRNIVIGALCGVLLLMAVGYAAFNTILTINGTASITSNWDIKITNIVSKNETEGASNAEDPTYEDLTATFSTNLVSPGDSIEYDVTIENKGSLDAELNKITLPQSNNEAIIITTSGIDVGSELKSQGSAVLTVKVTYSDEVTSQPDNLTANFEMTLDYVQKGASEASPQTVLSMKGVEIPIVTENDGLYEDSVEPGRYVYAGVKPDNYITFNGENAGWRIVSVESDGTIKIMRNSALTKMEFDSGGKRDKNSNGVGGTYCSQGSYSCNAWSKTTGEYVNGSYKGTVLLDSSLKTYLNGTYYDSITKNKTAIANHAWYYGSPDYDNNLSEMVTKEKVYSAESYVGLIQASDYIKSNTNTSLCATYNLLNNNNRTCKSTTWMVYSDMDYFTLTPTPDSVSNMWRIVTSGAIGFTDYTSSKSGAVPSLYLKSDVELEGQGTEGEPYTITNYVE